MLCLYLIKILVLRLTKPVTKTVTVKLLTLTCITVRCVADSLKATTKAKRGKGIHQRVAESAPIPGNWQDFLRVDLNKKEL